MVSAIKNFFSKILGKAWNNKSLYSSLLHVEDLIPKVGPFIKTAGDIITGMTPTNVDDAMWAVIKDKYSQLFDGSKVSKENAKLYALGIATDLIEHQFPEVGTTVARAAAQIAYLVEKNK